LKRDINETDQPDIKHILLRKKSKVFGALCMFALYATELTNHLFYRLLAAVLEARECRRKAVDAREREDANFKDACGST
jgi:hypothetical protein